jgi:hypothetical protein
LVERYACRGLRSWPATVTTTDDAFRYRRAFDVVRVPWSAIARFELQDLAAADLLFQGRRQIFDGRGLEHLGGVCLVLIGVTDAQGRATRRVLTGMQWPDRKYAEAVRVRDWLNSHVE